MNGIGVYGFFFSPQWRAFNDYGVVVSSCKDNQKACYCGIYSLLVQGSASVSEGAFLPIHLLPNQKWSAGRTDITSCLQAFWDGWSSHSQKQNFRTLVSVCMHV